MVVRGSSIMVGLTLLISLLSLTQGAVKVDNGANVATDANTINVTFYQMPESEWTDAEPKFKTSLSDQSDPFCEFVLEECAEGGDLDFSKELCTSCKINKTLSADDVTVLRTSNLKNNQQVSFMVVSQEKFTSTFVRDMLVERPFRYAVAESVGHAIVAVDDSRFSPMPTYLNAILVPICILITIAIFLVAIVCHYRNKKREKAAQELVMTKKAKKLEEEGAKTEHGEARERDPMV